MDTNQEIKISLKEYMELKDKAENTSNVRIEEKFFVTKNGEEIRVGTSIQWKNMKGAILHLMGKLKLYSEDLSDLHKERNKLKKMSIIEFIKWRKEP